MSLYSWQAEGLSRSRFLGPETPAVRPGKSFLGLGMADRRGLGEEEAAVRPGRPQLGMFCV